MRYACLIYYDPKTLFGGSPEANAVLADCSTYDDKLKESGHFVLGEALEMPESAMTVQVRGGKMSTVELTRQPAERRFLHLRLAQLTSE
jgi:hypothetical protein